MSQEFHVVRCCTCQSFQVQQVKKAKKWSCKLCGEKQSLLKEFGRGSGSDCRRHVQKLNAMRGALMEEQEHNTWSLWKQVEADRQDVPQQHDQTNWSSLKMKPVKTSLRNTSPPSENHTSPPSKNHTSHHTSPPRKKSINPPSASSGPVSRWACFLRADCQEEGEEPSGSGRSQSVGGAASLSCNDIISQASLLPASSMFDSGEDFSLDL